MTAREGLRGVLCTILEQAGPTPRGPGSKCLVYEDGTLMGSVGGGLLEAETIQKAREVMETGLPAHLFFSLKSRDVEKTDMICGGEVSLFLEPVAAPGHGDLYQNVVDVMKRGERGMLATVLERTRWQGGVAPKLWIGPSGQRTGSLHAGSQLEQAIQDRVGQVLRERSLALVSFPDENGFEIQVLLEPVIPPSSLFVFGGGHVSRCIVPLAARVGFQVSVVDDRLEFAHGALFPDAERVHHRAFDNVMQELHTPPGSYLVIVTRGHTHDKTVLAQALRTEARYIGMIGSKRKRDAIYDRLLQEGFTREDLARVHSPIGLSIGAETPEEIAVSIVGELIQERAGANR